MLRSIAVLMVLSAPLLLIHPGVSQQMTTIPALQNVRLQTKCDKSCTADQKNELVDAVTWVNTIEASSCFADEFRRHQSLDQKQWSSDHPGQPVRSTDEILVDLTTSHASTNTHMLKLHWWNPIQQIADASMCASEENVGNTTWKVSCFNDESLRDKAMTLGHELTHALGYEHTKNGFAGNAETVPYVTQDVLCRCWERMPNKPNPDEERLACDDIYGKGSVHEPQPLPAPPQASIGTQLEPKIAVIMTSP